MSQSNDQFASNLLEQAKRFLEKARESDSGSEAFLNAGLLLGVASLEAHLFGVASDFIQRPDLSLLDRSILEEKDYHLDAGEFKLTGALKMFRIDDRYEHLVKRFSTSDLPRDQSWWPIFKESIKLRNNLTHPKQPPVLSVNILERSILSIIDAIDFIYLAIYQRPLPTKNMGLQSKLTF